ncbi:hypothetical protein HHK36_020722 [Tetracentron sinense]|uniref:Uncharacterized protein n=1 Tax=Tetracentron sinense TaxID=13715 RepID=A0A834YUH2_TETSI|nr:hypothetical protein HHK36_020722 [Tetracentron sinense]
MNSHRFEGTIHGICLPITAIAPHLGHHPMCSMMATSYAAEASIIGGVPTEAVKELYDKMLEAQTMPPNAWMWSLIENCANREDINLLFQILQNLRRFVIFCWLVFFYDRLSNLRIHANFNCSLCRIVAEACARVGALDFGKKVLWKHNVYGLTPSIGSAHYLLGKAQEKGKIVPEVLRPPRQPNRRCLGRNRQRKTPSEPIPSNGVHQKTSANSRRLVEEDSELVLGVSNLIPIRLGSGDPTVCNFPSGPCMEGPDQLGFCPFQSLVPRPVLKSSKPLMGFVRPVAPDSRSKGLNKELGPSSVAGIQSTSHPPTRKENLDDDPFLLDPVFERLGLFTSTRPRKKKSISGEESRRPFLPWGLISIAIFGKGFRILSVLILWVLNWRSCLGRAVEEIALLEFDYDSGKIFSPEVVQKPQLGASESFAVVTLLPSHPSHLSGLLALEDYDSSPAASPHPHSFTSRGSWSGLLISDLEGLIEEDWPDKSVPVSESGRQFANAGVVWSPVEVDSGLLELDSQFPSSLPRFIMEEAQEDQGGLSSHPTQPLLHLGSSPRKSVGSDRANEASLSLVEIRVPSDAVEKGSSKVSPVVVNQLALSGIVWDPSIVQDDSNFNCGLEEDKRSEPCLAPDQWKIASWVLENIEAVGKVLGLSYLGQEVEVRDLFKRLEVIKHDGHATVFENSTCSVPKRPWIHLLLFICYNTDNWQLISKYSKKFIKAGVKLRRTTYDIWMEFAAKIALFNFLYSLLCDTESIWKIEEWRSNWMKQHTLAIAFHVLSSLSHHVDMDMMSLLKYSGVIACHIHQIYPASYDELIEVFSPESAAAIIQVLNQVAVTLHINLPDVKKPGVVNELQKLVSKWPLEVIKHKKGIDRKALAASLKSNIPAVVSGPSNMGLHMSVNLVDLTRKKAIPC